MDKMRIYMKYNYLLQENLFLKNGRKHLEEIYQPFLLEVLRCNLGLQEFSLLQELQLLRVTV